MSEEQQLDNGCLLRGDNVSSKNLRCLMEAANVATKSELNCRHGSVLVYGNRVLASGYNQSRSKYGNIIGCCMHAEVACLHYFIKHICHESFNSNGKVKNTKWKRILTKSSIYVVRIPRVNNSLEYLNYSKPCSSCYNTLKNYGIKNVIYSDICNGISVNKVDNLHCSHVTKGNLRVPSGYGID